MGLGAVVSQGLRTREPFQPGWPAGVRGTFLSPAPLALCTLSCCCFNKSLTCGLNSQQAPGEDPSCPFESLAQVSLDVAVSLRSLLSTCPSLCVSLPYKDTRHWIWPPPLKSRMASSRDR